MQWTVATAAKANASGPEPAWQMTLPCDHIGHTYIDADR
jgi:hypothetical protein